MRVPRVRTIPKPVCVICMRGRCSRMEACPEFALRVTRGLKRILDRAIPKPVCVVCNGSSCSRMEACPEYFLRVTRGLKRILDQFVRDFVILEDYRCMPLIGGEEDVPNWDMHIVHYSIVYVQKDATKLDN